MLNGVVERVQHRMNNEVYDKNIMDEIIQTVTDRICLRLGVNEETFPSSFQSVVVDASVKVWRRRYYEGIETEKVENLTTTFIADVLAEYQPEIERWLNSEAGAAANRRKVRFL